MKINEIITEGSGIYYDNMDRPYFNRIEDFQKALKSDVGFIRNAAQDVIARGGQEGWPEDWNASSTQDQYASQLTMPKASQQKPQYNVRRDANKVSTADISTPLSQPPVADPKIPIPAVPFKSSIKPVKYSPAIRSRRQ
jgi:hypothetical protein